MPSKSPPRRKRQQRHEAALAAASTLSVAFGQVLKRARRSAQVDADELCVALDISRATLSNFEVGATSPRAELLVRMAPMLKLHPAELFLRVPERLYELSFLEAPAGAA